MKDPRLGYIKSDSHCEAVECKMKDGEKYLWLVTLAEVKAPVHATGVSS